MAAAASFKVVFSNGVKGGIRSIKFIRRGQIHGARGGGFGDRHAWRVGAVDGGLGRGGDMHFGNWRRGNGLVIS